MSKLVRFVNHSLKDFFVSNAADEVEPYVEDLKKLHAPDGIFSVWGKWIEKKLNRG